MNYYEHHIGDYLKKTVHLTVVEEGVYRRLLDRYYISEEPLPLDVRECCKLARANSKAERDAVASVLKEFFTRQDDGHHQSRADEEIARYKDKQAKAKRSAEARWGAGNSECEGTTDGNANASANAMRTHMRTQCEGNAPRARPQSPVTSKPSVDAYASTPGAPSRKIELGPHGWEHIPDELRASWATAYPALEVDTELAKAAAWIIANPSNKKSNYARFLTNWLSRAQDRAPPARAAPAGNVAESRSADRKRAFEILTGRTPGNEHHDIIDV